MTDYKTLLQRLHSERVRFILVGGFAARILGSPRITDDLDILYDRSPENLEALAAALAPLEPYPRGAPPGLPFAWDAATLASGLNFTLACSAGVIDLLGEITGGGNYDALVNATELTTVFGFELRILNLDTLIAVKRAAGRPKDFEAIAELEALREERGD